MSLSYEEASNEMFRALSVLVSGELKAILGYEAEVRWPYVPEPDKPTTHVWMRVSRQTVIDRQDTLSTCVGLPGQKRYTTSGLLIIQLFAPRTGNAVVLTRVGAAIRNMYRKLPSPTSIMYRRVRMDPLIGLEDQYYRLNVVAETEYDEIM